MKTLVKTVDGGYYLLGGKTRSIKCEPPPPLELTAEMVAPPKKLKKVKKFHYTKPFENTYGKFLELFGNIYPHQPFETDNLGIPITLGNIYLHYDPDGPGGSFWSAALVEDNKVYFGVKWIGSYKIGPQSQHLLHVRYIYQELLNTIYTNKKYNRFVPLTDEVKPKEPVAHVEVKETERGCLDENCSWCHPQINPAKLSPGEMYCVFCRSKYHNWDSCPRGKFVDFIPHTQDNWTTEFCDKCGDINHLSAECDYVIPEETGGGGHNYAKEKSTMGNITEAPWTKRGMKINLAKDWHLGSELDKTPLDALWKVDNKEWDPLVANAELIILEFVAGNARMIAPDMDIPERDIMIRRGQEKLDELLDYIDPRLQAYTDMVVGGELRHHKAVGGIALPGPHQRPQAWKAWKQLRKIVGAQALLDAVVLFDDFEGESFGGMKWGVPCKLLWMRETGKISPMIFCDKVFDLQHNGGSLLNKVEWMRKTPYGISHIKTWLGPARALDPPDWEIILSLVDRDTVRLFQEYWALSNRYARLSGIEQIEVPRPRNINGERYRPRRKAVATVATGPGAYGFPKELWDYNLPYLDQALASSAPHGMEHWGQNLIDPVTGETITSHQFCEDHDCLTYHQGEVYLKFKPSGICDGCGIVICPLHETMTCTECSCAAAKNPHYVGMKPEPQKVKFMVQDGKVIAGYSQPIEITITAPTLAETAAKTNVMDFSKYSDASSSIDF